MVGHALIYSGWMDNLVNSNLRVRIYTMEYELPSKSKPETQYPYRHELLYRAYTTLLGMGISHNKIVIGGDSSGGFNTLKCFEEIIQNGTPIPGGIMLNSPPPPLDLWVPASTSEAEEKLGPGNSLALNEKKYYVGPKFLKNGMEAYKAPESPAPSHKGAQWYAEHLPATYIAYETHEVLLDGVREFQGAFNGKELTVFEGEGEIHVFNVFEMRYSRTRQI
jgi:acetyl esterase/lipase